MMGACFFFMGELTHLLRGMNYMPVHVFLADSSDYSDQKSNKCDSLFRIDLLIAPCWEQGPQTPISYFLGYVTPDKMDERNKEGELCNLDMFARQETFSLKRGYELRLLNKLMNVLAEVDPRISGRDTAPVVSIARIGGDRYRLDTVREQYVFVKQLYRENQKVSALDSIVAEF